MVSPKQWVGKGNEQDLTISIEEKTGASQRKVGGGATWRLMGLSDDTRTTNRKHSFRPRIRNGRSHPHGSRFARQSRVKGMKTKNSEET